MKIFKNDFIKNILNKYSYNFNDCGSTAIQIILIELKIKNLEIHIKKHNKDFSNKRGFTILLNKKKKLLKYFMKKNKYLYNDFIKDLKIIK